MGHQQKLGSHGKNQIFGPKTEILGPKKHPLFQVHHVLATTGKSCSKKKVAFSQSNISLFFGQKTTFRPNVKTAVSPSFRPGPGPLSLWDLKNVWMIWKVSEQSKKCPGNLENVSG